MSPYTLETDPVYINNKDFLTENRNDYQFDLAYLAPIPMLKGDRFPIKILARNPTI